MTKIKSAFTIAEVLIAIGIIGVIATFGLKAAIQNDKGIRHLYSNTYHVLDTALYNAINFSVTGSLDPFADNITNGNKNGSGISFDEGTQRLCQAITGYLNTVEPNPCEASSAIVHGTKVDRSARPRAGSRLISDVANDAEFTDDKVQFTATNGVRYFFSRRMPYSNGAGSAKYNTNDPKFFLIYADLNGKKFPNSLEYRTGADRNHRNRSKDPDIFAFAVIDNGRVLPLGPPEFDGRFMLSRVSYYNVENSRNEENSDVLYSKPSQPYYLTKAQAWGYYTNAPGAPDDTNFILDNPYSYNGYIKSKINANSRIYAFVQNYFSGGRVKRDHGASIKSNPVNGNPPGYNCVVRSDENCDVIIDKYVF